MSKTFFTYFLSLLLVVSIIAPTIISLSDYEICENSISIDIEEDTDFNEVSEESKELKIIETPLEFLALNACLPKEKINFFKNNSYNSINRTLDSPPPENAG